jgi:hypothetical protein
MEISDQHWGHQNNRTEGKIAHKKSDEPGMRQSKKKCADFLVIIISNILLYVIIFRHVIWWKDNETSLDGSTSETTNFYSLQNA